jgi:hypothetical protein
MKGRPFLGVISGFFFGLFGAVTLFLFGVIPLDSHLVWILPIVGIVIGLFMAPWAPFGNESTAEAPPTSTAPPPSASPSTDTPSSSPSTPDDTIVDNDPPIEPADPPTT